MIPGKALDSALKQEESKSASIGFTAKIPEAKL
jgi:hypothetical protein